MINLLPYTITKIPYSDSVFAVIIFNKKWWIQNHTSIKEWIEQETLKPGLHEDETPMSIFLYSEEQAIYFKLRWSL